MAVIEQYSGDILPQVLFGTAGTAGDMVYISTGSGLTHKSASTGTGVTLAFAGVLIDNVAAGSYGAVLINGVVQMPKHATANKIEVGDRLYGTKSSNKVGTVVGGTALGVCVKQSATTDPNVSVKVIPFWEMRGGFHA